MSQLGMNLLRPRALLVLGLLTATTAAATGCASLLGDFDVGEQANGPEGGAGNEGGTTDGPASDGNGTIDGGDAAVDGADSGCKVTPGGATFDDAVSVAAGYQHTCAIRQDGALYCWGDNAFGQLGVPQATALQSPKPIKVQFPPTLGTATITQVALTENVTFAIDSQLRLWVFGTNASGALANGTKDTNPHDVPSIVRIGGDPNGAPLLVRKIAPVWTGACALTATSEVMCWGGNAQGSLGPDTPVGTEKLVPVRAFTTAGTATPSAILAPGIGSAGSCYSDGIAANGMRCWGQRAGGYTLSTSPDPGVTYQAHVPLATAGAKLPLAQVSFGTNYGVARDSVGTLYTWGTNNNQGQHGSGAAPAAGTALAAPGTYTSMSAGYVWLCGIDGAKKVLCRGSNTQGQLGRPTPNAEDNPLMKPVVTASGGDLSNVVSVSAGFFTGCAIIQGACGANGPGKVTCWGQGDHGEIGDGNAANSAVAVDVKSP